MKMKLFKSIFACTAKVFSISPKNTTKIVLKMFTSSTSTEIQLQIMWLNLHGTLKSFSTFWIKKVWLGTKSIGKSGVSRYFYRVLLAKSILEEMNSTNALITWKSLTFHFVQILEYILAAKRKSKDLILKTTLKILDVVLKIIK